MGDPWVAHGYPAGVFCWPIGRQWVTHGRPTALKCWVMGLTCVNHEIALLAHGLLIAHRPSVLAHGSPVGRLRA